MRLHCGGDGGRGGVSGGVLLVDQRNQAANVAHVNDRIAILKVVQVSDVCVCRGVWGEKMRNVLERKEN